MNTRRTADDPASGHMGVVLDEPTAHLDFKNHHLALDMVKNGTKEKNLPAILTSMIPT